MDSPLISVIVPVYNVEDYLLECVESLIGQTYANLEILLIDDGSTDSSPEICEMLQSRDGRVRALHKENGGLSDARNYGVERAIGEYVSFIDGDDYLDGNAFETVVKELAGGADLVAFGIVLDFEDGSHVDKAAHERRVYSGTEGIVALNTFNGFDVSACNKVYRRTLFDNVRFPKGKLCEDFYVMPRIFDLANRIVLLPNPFYHYRQRSGSITKGTSFNMDFINAAEDQLAFLERNHPEISCVGESALGFAYLTYLNFCIDRCTLDDAVLIRNKMRDRCPAVLRCPGLPRWKRLQYLFACISPRVYGRLYALGVERRRD